MATDEPGDLWLPPPEFARKSLQLSRLRQSWFRSHMLSNGPIYFGRAGRWSFDDPMRDFGVMYLAFDAMRAFVETFCRDPERRFVTTQSLSERACSELICQRDLMLLDLTKTGSLTRLPADARLFSGAYTVSQAWSRAIYTHPSQPDGIVFRSRFDPAGKLVAIFDREPHDWAVKGMGTWNENRSLLAQIIRKTGMALQESVAVPVTVKKGPKQEGLF
jgi:hypothetical protein